VPAGAPGTALYAYATSAPGGNRAAGDGASQADGETCQRRDGSELELARDRRPGGFPPSSRWCWTAWHPSTPARPAMPEAGCPGGALCWRKS